MWVELNVVTHTDTHMHTCTKSLSLKIAPHLQCYLQCRILHPHLLLLCCWERKCSTSACSLCHSEIVSPHTFPWSTHRLTLRVNCNTTQHTRGHDITVNYLSVEHRAGSFPVCIRRFIMHGTTTQQMWASLTVRQKQVEDIFGKKETHYTVIHCPVKTESVASCSVVITSAGITAWWLYDSD